MIIIAINCDKQLNQNKSIRMQGPSIYSCYFLVQSLFPRFMRKTMLIANIKLFFNFLGKSLQKSISTIGYYCSNF